MWRRPLNRQGNKVHASEQHQPEHPLLLALRLLQIFGPNLAKLLAVGENEVEVAVKSQEGANEHASIEQGDPNAILHVLRELGALAQLRGRQKPQCACALAFTQTQSFLIRHVPINRTMLTWLVLMGGTKQNKHLEGTDLHALQDIPLTPTS